MKKIRLRAINLPEGFGSNWVEYEVEEIPEEQEEKCQCGLKECICAEPEETQELLHPCLNFYLKEGMVSKEEVLKVFDESFVAWNKLHRYPTTFKNHFRKALEEM